LHRITVPTLFLWGDADRVIPVGLLPVWRSYLAHAEELVLAGVGHLLFDESGAAVEALAAFAAPLAAAG
jgi:pimeloyl-ACP methyl ester carboxylesterase